MELKKVGCFFGLASARTFGRMGRPDTRAYEPFLVPMRAHTALNITSIGKEGEGAQPTPGGGGNTEVRQQKARREMQHSIYF
jgi:hypothetical protein